MTPFKPELTRLANAVKEVSSGLVLIIIRVAGSAVNAGRGVHGGMRVPILSSVSAVNDLHVTLLSHVTCIID